MLCMNVNARCLVLFVPDRARTLALRLLTSEHTYLSLVTRSSCNWNKSLAPQQQPLWRLKVQLQSQGSQVSVPTHLTETGWREGSEKVKWWRYAIRGNSHTYSTVQYEKYVAHLQPVS